MTWFARRNFPWLGATSALWICVLVLCAVVMSWNDGRFVYALDDGYIHMAVAKNLVEHGEWGVTPEGFSSATSSLAWPALLAAGYLVLGAVDWLPLVMSLVCAALLLRAAQRELEPVTPSGQPAALPRRRATFLALLVVVFLTGLPAVILTGLEHVLHTWVNLVFCFGVASSLSADRPDSRRAGAWIALAALLPLVRFEAMATVLIVAALHVLRRRWWTGIAIGVTGLAPVAVYGAISRGLGWWVLPNSVLLKANHASLEELGSLADLLGRAWNRALHAPDLSVLLLASALLCVLPAGRPRVVRERRRIATVIFWGSALFQILFARTGSLYRYDLFLIVFGLVLVLSQVLDRLPAAGRLPGERGGALRRITAVALVLVASVPFVLGRGLGTFVNAPRACANIHRQPFQMGLFLARFYPGASIAVNDIGAVCWLGEPKLVDLAGLATMEVARLRRAQAYTPEAMRDLCRARGTRVAVAYPGWYGKPEEWTRVGSWEIASDVGIGSRTVVFYALADEERAPLAANLHAFAAELPADVQQTIF